MTTAAIILPATAWGMYPTTFRPRLLSAVVLAVVHHSASRPPADHRGCAPVVRSFDRFHRRPVSQGGRGWAGIGYHRVTCAHGVTFEGRPLGAVGAHSEPVNVSGVGYCLIGAGDEPAGPAQLAGLAAAIRADELTLGRELRITDHRRAEPGSTTCPGDGIEGQLGELRRLRSKVTAPAPKPSPAPRPAGPPFPGRHWFRLGVRSDYARTVGRLLVRHGFDHHSNANGYQPGPVWTAYDQRNLADFQRSIPALRDAADGVPGPLTWRFLHEPVKRHKPEACR